LRLLGVAEYVVYVRVVKRAEGVASRPTGARSRLPRKRADNTGLQIELHTLSLNGRILEHREQEVIMVVKGAKVTKW
jgi:hypothetical protein